MKIFSAVIFSSLLLFIMIVIMIKSIIIKLLLQMTEIQIEFYILLLIKILFRYINCKRITFLMYYVRMIIHWEISSNIYFFNILLFTKILEYKKYIFRIMVIKNKTIFMLLVFLIICD